MPSDYHRHLAAQRDEVITRLHDAAESLMRAGEPLTAGAVAEAVGIKRNSVYRYIDSIDDLRAGVLARYVPGWIQQIRSACAAADTPAEKVAAYVDANLRQADERGHGWLVKQAEGLSHTSTTAVASGHHELDALLDEPLRTLDPDTPAITHALLSGIVSTGFDLLDSGTDSAQVIEGCVRAARSVIAALPDAGI